MNTASFNHRRLWFLFLFAWTFLSGTGRCAEFGSYRFDGKGGRVELSDFSFPPEGCVSLLVKLEDTANNRCLLAFSAGPDQAVTLAFGLTHLLFTVKAGEEIHYAGIPKERVPIGRWVAITVTFTSGKAWFFLNGNPEPVLQVGSRFSNPFLDPGTLFLGSGPEGNDSLKGDIASLLILDNPFYTDGFTLFPLSSPGESGVVLDIRSDAGGGMADHGPGKRNLSLNGTVDLASTHRDELQKLD